MSWVVVVVQGLPKVYGTFESEEIARALARGLSSSGSGSVQAHAVRMEKP